jgi:rhodanese-related sulfurtransferase
MDGEIDPDEVQSLVEGEDPPRIVDIRSPGAFARGHIPGSVNIPLGELPTRVATLEGADHIVTVCPHGQASIQAARLVGSYEGTSEARTESMRGGLEAWDGPLEQATEDPVGANADEGPDAPF